MTFFDELSSKILSGSKAAVNKAKEVADITKLKTEMMSEESKLRSVYAEIGKLYCDKAEGEIDPEFQPLLEKAAVSKAAIAEYKADIQKIKGTSRCPECGAEVSGQAQFCSSCGAPVPVKTDDSVEKGEDGGCEEESGKDEEPAGDDEENCCCSQGTEE